MRHFRVENLSRLRQDVAMRQARVVPGKHVMSALMLALKEAEIKSEAIQLHLQQVHIETQHLKDKN